MPLEPEWLAWGPGLHPARLAARADYVLLVGDLYRGIELAAALRELGVEADIYPLSPLEAPTLYSILGLAGLIRRKLLHGEDVLVVAEEPGELVRAAYRLIYGGAEPESSLDALTSPLHYRLLRGLHLLRLGGVDLAREATRSIPHAFTGGDAQASDTVLQAADIEQQLGPRGLAAKAYTQGLSALNAEERRVLQALRGDGSGSASVIALPRTGNRLDAVIGCRALLHPRQCIPEAEALQEPLAALAEKHGLEPGAVEQAEPEEAACIAYPEYPC